VLAVAPLPVFAWELGLALFLIIKGFRIAAPDQHQGETTTRTPVGAIASPV